MKKHTRHYTIIGYYDDNGQCFSFIQRAVNEIEACRLSGLSNLNRENMVFVDVIMGQHASSLHTDSVHMSGKTFFFEDLPEPQ